MLGTGNEIVKEGKYESMGYVKKKMNVLEILNHFQIFIQINQIWMLGLIMNQRK